MLYDRAIECEKTREGNGSRGLSGWGAWPLQAGRTGQEEGHDKKGVRLRSLLRKFVSHGEKKGLRNGGQNQFGGARPQEKSAQGGIGVKDRDGRLSWGLREREKTSTG